MKDQDLFLNFINQNYVDLKNKYWKFCQENFYDWDEDADIVRWMCAFDTTEVDIESFAELLRKLMLK
jgi:threonine aldolase